MCGEYILPIVMGIALTSCAAWANGPGPVSLVPLEPIPIGATTGEKPQSKVWTYDGQWWAVLPDSHDDGVSKLWVLNDNGSWHDVATLSDTTALKADICLDGELAHVLLHDTNGRATELVTLAYSEPLGTYRVWSRPRCDEPSVPVDVGKSVEATTLAVDSQGRLWIACDTKNNEIVVHWSDWPYDCWSDPVVLASKVHSDDICVVTALPNGTIGVLWSDQRHKEFGFRFHADADRPDLWSDPEIIDDGDGGRIADDHLNVAVASDGTLYAAVKTSYDDAGRTLVGLLVREGDGRWHDLYHVDDVGTRPLVLLNEELRTVTVVYAAGTGGGGILYRQSRMYQPARGVGIEFGLPEVLIDGSGNDPTSTRQNWKDEVVVLASDGSAAQGVLMRRSSTSPRESLVAHWAMDESGGSTLYDTAPGGEEDDAFVQGSPSWTAGVCDRALVLGGRDDYALVPHSDDLDIRDEITLAAWVRPEEKASQKIVSKVRGNAGYALALSSKGVVKIKFNGTNDLRLYSDGTYPTNGRQWMHVAATYDGQTIRIYLNGQEDVTMKDTFHINTHTDELALGAKADGSDALAGTLDEVRIYNRALTDAEIEELAHPCSPLR